MASGVPKFTSFRPKAKENLESLRPAEDQKPEKHPRSGRSHRDRSPERRPKSGTPSRVRSSERDEGSQRPSRDRSPERHRRRRKTSRERSPGKGLVSSSRQPDNALARRQDHQDPDPSREEAASSKLFFSDRRGDLNIVKYGSLNRYEVPDYRRFGYGHVLGLPLDMKIDRDLSTDKAIVLTHTKRRAEERLLTKKHATKEQNKAIRFVNKSDEGDDPWKSDFISLSAIRKRKRDEEGSSDDEDTSFDYRGIGDVGSEKPIDPDAEYESDTTVLPVDAEATARNSILVRKTKDDPEDLQAWLALIEHQESMMKIGRSLTELRSTDRQHLADIRISIYDQALRKVKDTESNQVVLYCGMMTEAARAWSETQMASKWTEILTKFPFNLNLWLKYLDFVQSSFSSFRYEACKTTFQKCLETMQLGPTPANTNLCLYIFTRLTTMIRQAGYQELSLAVWQAMLEYHMLAPPQAHQSAEEALQMFEEFWESEVARIGEPNAKGWLNYNVDDEALSRQGVTPLIESNSNDDILDDFRRREMDCIIKLRNPGRTTDEEGEDDPFHTVLFSDVEAFLKPIPPPCDKVGLLSAFLESSGLPPLLRNGSYDGKYVLDPFLKSEFHTIQSTASNFTQLISQFSNCPIKCFQPTTELLFDQSFPEMTGIFDLEAVKNVLKLLATNFPDEEAIGEYLLALESKYFPEEVVRTAKQLLKKRPTSLRLYNAYGLVESRRGNSAKADQVFSAALSMQKGDTPFSTPGSLELYYSWTWEALGQGNRKEALWRLVSSNGKTPETATGLVEDPNQAALLRARRALSDTSERALLGGDLTVAAMATSLIAALAYTSGDGMPDSALTIFGQLSAWFATHNMTQSPAAELHAQYMARFLTYHAKHAPIVKPSLLRDALEPLIATFPNNTILLSVYAANEARFAIDDRVRSIMHRSSIDKDRTIVGWTFAIHYETLRGEIAGSTAHSIRALFKKAEDDVGAHCPALWRQHVLFEIEEAKKERAKRPRKKSRKEGKKSEESRAEEADQRVKDTFFRGLTHLPWCKEYMMLAFTHLGEEFLGREDLRKVYNVMAEKELRLYVELEDGGVEV